ncbi:alanine/glycine:cation symporter family protein [Entomospira entomophila]|uniref:Alanine:cation symporter family protein n=1 Tax=Entomospira entomophila TaxID=2719988 RepID=A0A968KU19_9SPIO|nr:alanine/glycine:cation symporter family protein [Entomospira entomophilus]NIZ40981.1 alanine:cation symporter family protein [Entomospira entomophilus]WDI35194.1 alanine/glycine:cation symporter family protein [Entomospira entomophilus]
MALVFEWINKIILDYFFVLSFLIGGAYFTVKMGFIQIRYFPKMLRILLNGSTPEGLDNSEQKGLSSLQAFLISTASRVGTGNLIGVSMAITIGGIGAAFWMWVMALLGMATALVESSLAQLYKKPDGNGFFVGGPSYYMRMGLNSPLLSKLFMVAILFVVFIMGSMMQINAVALELYDAFAVPKWVIGIIVSFFILFTMMGGLKRIADISTIAVPLITISYLLLAGYLMIRHANMLPMVFQSIFREAFNIQSTVAGGLGTVIAMGVRRGLMSNEAGMGTAAAAAAVASTSHPVKQGLIQSFSVFLDTFLICTATVMIIVLAPSVDATTLGDTSLLSYALQFHLGNWAGIFLSFMILVLAVTTMTGYLYYGESSVRFFSQSKRSLRIYQGVFLTTVFAGAVLDPSITWQLVDYSLAFAALTNLYAIWRLFPQVESLVKDFEEQYAKEGNASLDLEVKHYEKHNFTTPLAGWEH